MVTKHQKMEKYQTKWSIGNGDIEMFNTNHRSMFIDFTFWIDSSSWDRNGSFDNIEITIENVSWGLDNGDLIENCVLNDRNIKRIEKMIENAINEDPERFGMDMDDFDWDDDEPTIWNTLYSGYPSRVRDL